MTRVAVSPYRPLTIQRVAMRIRTGEDTWLCIREFLDDFYAAGDDERAALLSDPPEPVGDRRFDVYLAALAEHLAVQSPASFRRRGIFVDDTELQRC